MFVKKGLTDKFKKKRRINKTPNIMENRNVLNFFFESMKTSKQHASFEITHLI